VIEAVEHLAEVESGDVRPLRGRASGEWRLRVGAIRVLFVFLSDSQTIQVHRVLPRGRADRE